MKTSVVLKLCQSEVGHFFIPTFTPFETLHSEKLDLTKICRFRISDVLSSSPSTSQKNSNKTCAPLWNTVPDMMSLQRNRKYNDRRRFTVDKISMLLTWRSINLRHPLYTKYYDPCMKGKLTKMYSFHITKYPGIYCTLVNYSLLPSTKYSTPYQE